MHTHKATKHLKDVPLQKQWVPFRRSNGGVGGSVHPGQTVGLDTGTVAEKDAELLLHMLKNAE